MLTALQLLATPLLATLPEPLTVAPGEIDDPRFTEHTIAEVPEGLELTGPGPAARMPLHQRTVRGAGFVRGTSMHCAWTEDGETVAYVARRADGPKEPGEEEVFAVIGDETFGPYLDVFGPVAGRTADEVAFRCVELTDDGPRWFVLHGGEEGERHGWVGPVAFSPKDGTLCYWTEPTDLRQPPRARNTFRFALHGLAKRPKPKTKINRNVRPVWDSKGKGVLSLAVLDGEWCVMHTKKGKDKNVGRASDGLVDLVAGPDLDAWAFAGVFADRTEKPKQRGFTTFFRRTVVRNGEVRIDDDEEFDAPVLSPDGEHLAFRSRRRGGREPIEKPAGVLIDGREVLGERVEFVSNLTWSADSSHLAFVVSNKTPIVFGPGSVPSGVREDTLARGDRDHVVVVTTNGEVAYEGDGYPRIDSVALSADGTQVAWVESDGDAWRVRAGDAVSGSFDEVGRLWFSDDGTRVAFGTREGNRLGWSVLEL